MGCIYTKQRVEEKYERRVTHMSKSKTWQKVVSLVVTLALVITMLPNTVANAKVTKAATETATTFLGPIIGSDGKVTFQYQGDGSEAAVQVKGSWAWDDTSKYVTLQKGENNLWTGSTTNLSLGSSYEYGLLISKAGSTSPTWSNDTANPTAGGGNSKINRNPQNNLDGSVTLYYYPKTATIENGKVLYRVKGSSDAYKEAPLEKDKTYTSIYSANITGLEKGTYEYKYSISGVEEAELNAAAPEFKCVGEIPAENPTVKSGVVTGSKVKFAYYAPFAKEVLVAGSFTSWKDNAIKAVYNSATGYWEAEAALTPGIYEYKLVVDNTWLVDANNSQTASDGNSQFAIEGLTVDASTVQKGNSVELPSKGVYYTVAGNEETATGITYTLDKEIAGVTLKGNTLTVDATVEKGTQIALTAVDAKGNKGSITINVVEKLYKYTIYYTMLEDGSWKNNSSLWIWQAGGSDGASYPFTSTYTDEKSQITWIKAEVELSYKELNMIARQGDWESQDSTRSFTMPEGKESATLWIIDSQGLYTEKPADLKPAAPRYVVLEYNRPEKDFDGWNIYEWSSGYAMKDEEIKYPFTVTADNAAKATTTVKIKSTISAFSFIIRKSIGEKYWTEKDLGDRSVSTPLDQTVIKARITEGSSDIEVLPYNKGYELSGKENKVNFYYRNDDLFLTDKQQTENVKLELAYVPLNATTGASIACDMTYNKETERFEYTYKNADQKLGEGAYYYRYIISDVKDASKTEVKTDVFNTNKTVKFDNNEYSYLTYRNYQAVATASVSKAEINYNQNAILSVAVTGAAINGKAANLDGMEIADCYADLTGLGGKKEVSIDPELMKLSIAVTDSTSLGKKIIPITVVDQYGNEFTTTAEVTVVERTTADKDFDWDESVIYFMVTDRFKDGNTSNNDAYGVGDYDTKNPGKYHGGDFKGVTEKLDYLQNLGVNTIWLTPIVENVLEGQATTNADVPATYGYHGYWAKDFQSLNKHLGTPAEFQELVDEAHARGMKIMVDVVLNHAGYDTEELEQFKDMFRTDANTVKDDYILSSDKSSGLPDFTTEDANVRNKLINWQTYWVKTFGIDYFRIDTVKHVESTTWDALKNKLTEIDPEFKMIGEYYGAGYANSFGYLKSGSMDSLLDFDFNDNVRSFVTGNLESMEKYFENRNAAIDNTATLGSFLSSHDEDGIQYQLQDEDKLSKEEAYNETMVAASLQMTAKGQPVIYYGEEIGLVGADDYPYQTNRYDMKFTNLSDSETKMLNHYKKLLSIRNNHTKVFAKGTRTKVAGSDAEKYMVFARSYQNEALYVGVNIAEQDKEVTLTNSYIKNGVVTDLYSGKVYPVINGKVTVTIPKAANGGTVVLQLNKNGTEITSDETAGTVTVKTTSVDAATDGAVKATAVSRVVYNASGTAISSNVVVTPEDADIVVINGTAKIQVKLSDTFINDVISNMNLTEKTSLNVSLGTKIVEKVIAKDSVKSIEMEVIVPDSAKEKLSSITVKAEQPLVAAVKVLAKKLVISYYNISNKAVAWTFTANDLKNSEVTSASAVNCDVVVTPATGSSIATAILSKDKNNSKGLLVNVKNTATLPSTATVKVYVGTQQGVTAGKTAYIYYLNETTSKLEEIAVSKAKVSAAGYLFLCITKGGKYVVLGKEATDTVTKTLKDCIKVTIPKTVKKGKTVNATVTLSGCLVKVTSLSSSKLKKLQSGTIGAKVTYQSSNKKVATISSAGKIKGKKKGKTVIKVTIKLSNGKSYSASRKITVK